MVSSTKTPEFALESSSRLMRNYFRALKKLTNLSVFSFSPERLLDSFVDSFMDLLEVEQASVMLLDPVTDELTIRVSRGLPASQVRRCHLRPGEGIAGRVLLGKETYSVAAKTSLSARYRRSPHEPGAALYIPLIYGHESRGIIALGSSVQRRYFAAEEAEVAAALAAYMVLTMENARLSNEISGLSLSFLKTLAMAIDAKDNYTRMHSMRVTRYAVMLGVRMGVSQDDIELLRRAALLHDIGKIGIRDDILLKPTTLTKKEYDIIRKHPEIGARILGPEGPLRSIVSLVFHHHERYDGSGYPHGLRGVEIPEGARIIAVADSFEAMTSDRPYRRAFSIEKAARELQQNAGSQFDPDIVKVFMEILKDGLPEAGKPPRSGRT